MTPESPPPSDEDVRRCIAADATTHVRKPVDFPDPPSASPAALLRRPDHVKLLPR